MRVILNFANSIDEAKRLIGSIFRKLIKQLTVSYSAIVILELGEEDDFIEMLLDVIEVFGNFLLFLFEFSTNLRDQFICIFIGIFNINVNLNS